MELMRTVPKGVRTIEVWNTLLSKAYQAKSYKLGYQVYLEVCIVSLQNLQVYSRIRKQMKLRGYIPNTATYITMFKYMNYIDDWDWQKHTKQLDRMNNLYVSYCDYVNGIKSLTPSSTELSTVPTAQYISILGKSGLFDKALETFHLMDDTGRLSPDQRVYTSLFQTIGRRTGDANALHATEQNAVDVKFFWKEMERKVNDGLFEVDSHTLFAALNVLRKGGKEEQEFALGLVERYLGLGASESTTTERSKIKLSPAIMQAVLLLCNALGKYELCERIVNTVRSRHGATEALDCRNMEILFQAFSSMPPSDSDPVPKRAMSILSWMLEEGALGHASLRPTRSAYYAVLTVCWRHLDWDSALKTYELMTGVNVPKSLQNTPLGDQRTEPPPVVRRLLADPITFSYLTRTARAKRDIVATRQCIVLFEMLGGVTDLLASHIARGMTGLDEGSLKHISQNLPYYKKILAEDVVELYSSLISADLDELASERDGWRKQRELAREAVKKFTHVKAPKTRGDKIEGDGVLPGAVIFQQHLNDPEEKKRNLWKQKRT